MGPAGVALRVGLGLRLDSGSGCGWGWRWSTGWTGRSPGSPGPGRRCPPTARRGGRRTPPAPAPGPPPARRAPRCAPAAWGAGLRADRRRHGPDGVLDGRRHGVDGCVVGGSEQPGRQGVVRGRGRRRQHAVAGAGGEEVADLPHRASLGRVLDHRRLEQRGHPAGVGQPRGLVVDDPVEPAEHVVAHLVRRPAGQHVEERGAQRPHVDGLVAALAGGDLRGQVGRGAGDETGLGERRVPVIRAMPKSVSFTRRVPVDQDVRRLHVPVHDAGRVGGDQGVRRLPQQRRGVVGGEPALGPDQLGQGGPVDVLHHQPAVVGVGVGDEVEDRHHVRVVEPRGQLRLALGAGEIGAVRARQETDPLERHRSPEHLVVAEPDCAHAAASDLTVERVPACDHERLPGLRSC